MFEKIKEKYRFAKENLNDVRYKFNYILVPSILLFCVLDLIVLFVLFCFIKNNNIVIISLLMLSLLFLCLLALLVINIIVYKKEKEIEANKLITFFDAKILESPMLDYVLPRADTGGVVNLKFSKEGITIGDLQYNYSDFEVALYTSNYMFQINLVLVFSKKEDLEEEVKGVKEFSLPFNLNLLSIMDKFKIDIINPDVLRFIKENPKIAANQILKYGKIQNNYYNVK